MKGDAKPLLNTMWDNELLMFINETQLIDRRKGRQTSRGLKRKKKEPPTKKALFDFLLWDLLSLLKCLIGSINI